MIAIDKQDQGESGQKTIKSRMEQVLDSPEYLAKLAAAIRALPQEV
jgi:hypothetical protein